MREHAGRGGERLPSAIGAQNAVRRLRLGAAAFCGAPAAEADVPQVHLGDDGGWLASFDLDETLRPGATEAVATLRHLGLQPLVLSGDHPAPFSDSPAAPASRARWAARRRRTSSTSWRRCSAPGIAWRWWATA